MRLYAGLIAFAVAFGYLEAAVVVYLREIYYPGGFRFPIVPIPLGQAKVELAREAATLVMLWGVAVAAGRTAWERFGHFAFLFGVWDIAFYAGLVIAIGWPPSLLTWDILFLIPVIWTGPVLAPLLVSILLIGAGGAIAIRERRGRPVRVRRGHWIAGALSLSLLLYSFMANHSVAYAGGVPTSFPWIVHVAGLLIAAGSAVHLLRT